MPEHHGRAARDRVIINIINSIIIVIIMIVVNILPVVSPPR